MIFTGSTQPEDFLLKLNRHNQDGLFWRFIVTTPLSKYDIEEAVKPEGECL